MLAVEEWILALGFFFFFKEAYLKVQEMHPDTLK